MAEAKCVGHHVPRLFITNIMTELLNNSAIFRLVDLNECGILKTFASHAECVFG